MQNKPWKNLRDLKNNNIHIIGAGGFGREVRSFLEVAGFQFQGFVDDNLSLAGVSCTISEFGKQEEITAVLAIGDSNIRKSIHAKLPAHAQYPIILHPSVILQDTKSIQLGDGVIACAASIFTCNIQVGAFSIINLNCTIGHDVKMGEFCSLMPSVNLSGSVTLGNGVFIGSGATILQGITIGDGAVIGAGAVVTKDVAPHTTVVGVPARPIK